MECSEEGARLDGRICSGGIWVADGPVGADGGTGDARGGGGGADLGLPDAGAPDGAFDLGSGGDLGEDASIADAGVDASVEMGTDGGIDAGTDGGTDAGMDSGSDVGMDGGDADMGGGDADMCVPESAADLCARLGYECGAVDETDNCFALRSVDCGACGADAFCRGDYTCECDAGFVGDGFTCTPTPLALSVQTVTVTLDALEGSDTATLPTPLTNPAQAVPFATWRLAGTGPEISELTIDVTIDDANTITVRRRRNDLDGAGVAVVTIVEFDPAHAKVQSGAYTFGGTSHAEPITAVDRAKSFVVFYALNDSFTSWRKDALMVAGDLAPSGAAVAFQRDDDTADIEGTYYVVEATGSAFAVRRTNGSIAQGSTQTDLGVPPSSASSSGSLLLYAHSASHGDDTPSRTMVGCELESATNVRCARRSNDSSIPEIRAQIVDFASSVSVYRGSAAFGDGVDADNASIGQTVGARAMAFGGHLGAAGACESDSSSDFDSEGAFFTQEIVNGGTEVRLERDEDGGASTVYWQVVGW